MPLIKKIKDCKIAELRSALSNQNTIEKMFENIIEEEEDDEYTVNKRSNVDDKLSLLELINNKNVKRDEKIDHINAAFETANFPTLEGDKVTFIGSTFWRYGEEKPYLNNCIVLDTCDPLKEIENSEIETYTKGETSVNGMEKSDSKGESGYYNRI